MIRFIRMTTILWLGAVDKQVAGHSNEQKIYDYHRPRQKSKSICRLPPCSRRCLSPSQLLLGTFDEVKCLLLGNDGLALTPKAPAHNFCIVSFMTVVDKVHETSGRWGEIRYAPRSRVEDRIGSSRWRLSLSFGGFARSSDHPDGTHVRITDENHHRSSVRVFGTTSCRSLGYLC